MTKPGPKLLKLAWHGRLDEYPKGGVRVVGATVFKIYPLPAPKAVGTGTVMMMAVMVFEEEAPAG